jgi:hypothetical protein
MPLTRMPEPPNERPADDGALPRLRALVVAGLVCCGLAIAPPSSRLRRAFSFILVRERQFSARAG